MKYDASVIVTRDPSGRAYWVDVDYQDWRQGQFVHSAKAVWQIVASVEPCLVWIEGRAPYKQDGQGNELFT